MKPLFALAMLASLSAGAPALAQTVDSADQPPTTAAPPAPVDSTGAMAPAAASGDASTTSPPPASVTASRPVPDTSQASPGIPGPEAVNPAPGASGPYVGHGPHAFYDVDARITNVQGRIASLSPGQQRQANAALKSIRGEEATQRQRHGDLRDWDRENLNYKLDKLVQQFPALGPSSGAQAPVASQ